MYSAKLIDSIANWQNGWREIQDDREKLSAILAELSHTVPEAAKTVPDRCYRIVYLDKSLIFSLISNSRLDERIASWTTDRAFTEKFKGAYREDHIGFIFAHVPEPSEVIVNIPAMWEDENFVNTLAKFKEEGCTFHKALEHFRGVNDQKEVILNVLHLAVSEIVGLSGVSDFDHICQLAGAQTEEEKDELWKTLVGHEKYPGEPVWLSEQGAERVLDRLIIRLEEIIGQVRNQNR